MTASLLQQDNIILLNLPDGSLSDLEFFKLCQKNPELKIERNATGQLIIMSPTGSRAGNYNAELNTELGIWNRKHRLGRVFDSSTGFRLPNGATYGPDAAWVSNARWDALTTEEQEQFAPIVPDFIIELRSRHDDLEPLQAKIEEFISCGCRMAWLVDPYERHTLVYEGEQLPYAVPFEEVLRGGEVLPGFAARLEDILK
jgi:Uma2 family endonuclease